MRTNRRAAVNRALDNAQAHGAIREWHSRRIGRGWEWLVEPASASVQSATLKGIREAECYAAGLAAALTARRAAEAAEA